MKKNLPVKLFKKRYDDKQLNNLAVIGENMGNKFKLGGEALASRSSYFRNYFSDVAKRIDEKRKVNNYLPTVVKLRINDDALAKTYRGEIGKLFNVNRKSNIIGMIGDNTLLLKIDDEKDLALIQDKISDITKNVVGLSAIEEADEFKPMIEDQNLDVDDIKVRLINYGDFRLNEIAERNFEKLCAESNTAYQKLNYTKDLILYRVSKIKKEVLAGFGEAESIFSIKKMPTFKLTKESLPATSTVKIKKPESGAEYFKVGVFDEATSDIPHLKDWKDGSFKAFDDGFFDNEHGTFIAGIINYGDDLEGKDWTGTKPFKITEGIIFPNAKYGYIGEYELVAFMREAIKKYPEIKIWNFSIGHIEPLVNDQYSDFAKYLDELQDEFNVLIVKAAGNCENFLKSAPRGRINQASESIRTLVVGSIAHEMNLHDIAPVNYPSPFSMVGPGISSVIKPDLTHYGGNAGLNKGVLQITGVKSFRSDGTLASAIGTSYSTPRVSGLAAELTGSLKEEFNPLLIKALLIHSAKHPEEFDEPLEDRLNQIGFGLPSKIDDILYNDPDEITLILMDNVDKGSHIKIMDFPYPSCLVDDGYFYGQAKITLVTAPMIDAYQGAEYIQTDVDVSFGTYEKKQAVVDSKIKRNPIETIDAKNILLPSIYSVNKQKSATSAFKSERFLKSYSDLFIPVKKHCIDLTEVSEANKLKALGKDRLWFLKLESSYRSSYESKVANQQDMSQEFVLIITLRDHKKKGRLYDEVNQLLTKFNFIHENLRVSEQVRIK
ncbi:MAG: S8 family peptidase [Bacteroidetes bacterium]|nr:S8 family peptidase [Bacteroidota bacterium]